MMAMDRGEIYENPSHEEQSLTRIGAVREHQLESPGTMGTILSSAKTNAGTLQGWLVTRLSFRDGGKDLESKLRAQTAKDYNRAGTATAVTADGLTSCATTAS